MGPLGLGSPRLRPRCPAAPGPAVLRVATTAFVLPGWFAFGSLPVPWVDALSLCPARLAPGSARWRPRRSANAWVLVVPVTLLRLLLPRRREALPSSRITPLSACPALRPRWCPCPLALARTGLLPSERGNPSAFCPVARTYPLTTTIHFSELNSRPAPSPSLCFEHRLSAIALRFGYRPGG